MVRCLPCLLNDEHCAISTKNGVFVTTRIHSSVLTDAFDANDLAKGEIAHIIKECVLFYFGFTPLLTLFQLYRGGCSIMYDPWVNKPVLGWDMCLAQWHSTMSAAGDDRFQIPEVNQSTTADSYILKEKRVSGKTSMVR